MVARGVCKFHVSERKRIGARAERRNPFTFAELIATTQVLFALACAPAAESTEELLVGAAVSLSEPLAAIAQDFETRHPGVRVQLSLAASSTLAAQARAGAPLDVFVAAHPKWIDQLERETWSEARGDVARNSIIVVTADGFALERAEDLIAKRLRRLALPAQAVPLGGYAREWLAQRGLLEALTGRIVLTEHARATLAAVEAGHVDAAIVYDTDVRNRPSPSNTLVIPRAEQPHILYTAALHRGASDVARQFFITLRAAEARAHFADAGFEAP